VIFKQYWTVIEQLLCKKNSNIFTVFVVVKASVDGTMESIYMPLFDQFIHNNLLECCPSPRQIMLLQF